MEGGNRIPREQGCECPIKALFWPSGLYLGAQLGLGRYRGHLRKQTSCFHLLPENHPIIFQHIWEFPSTII